MHLPFMMRETKIMKDRCIFMGNSIALEYTDVLGPLDLCGRLSYRTITREDTVAVRWMESYIQSHPNSHFLQMPQWADVKAGWDWRGILVYRDGMLAGAMSVLIRRLLPGISLFYVPRGPVCDRKDPFVMSELMVAAENLAREQGAILMLMDPDESSDNRIFREIMTSLEFREREDTGFGNIQAQHVFRLPLLKWSREEVFQHFSAKTRYNIRLALRKGVQVRQYSGANQIPERELEAFSALMEETGQRDRFLVRDQEYFRRVLRSLGREAVLFMAYLGEEPIAGTIGVFSGRKGWYLYGASANAHRNAMPNYLLQWEMIQYALEQDCRFYDFRGVPGDQDQDNPLHGLYRFKKGFGGDYTKFTGLYVYRFRPVLAWCFELALGVLRKYRTIRLKHGKTPPV